MVLSSISSPLGKCYMCIHQGGLYSFSGFGILVDKYKAGIYAFPGAGSKLINETIDRIIFLYFLEALFIIDVR